MTNSLKIYIDGQPLACVEQPKVVISYDAEQTRSVERARAGRVVEMVIALDDEGEAIFAGEGYLHALQRFNHTSHMAQIEWDGEVIMEGAVTLRGIERDGAVSRYRVAMEWSSGEWAERAATTLISLLPIEYSAELRQPDIIAAWSAEGAAQSPVQFFPVHRDDYEAESSSVSLEVVRRVRGVDDYHPFLKVAQMVRAVAQQSGYTIESALMGREEFRNIYMSGAYRSQYNDVARAAMDFKVSKSESESAEADYAGRVSISPYIVGSAISSIVDLESLESDYNCFETNDCLREDDGAVCFVPTTAVSVGFEYRLRYVTDYKITSRERLTGFDTFYFGEAPVVKIDIVNNFVDERGGEMESGLEYLLIVFDHEPGAIYRLVGCVDGAAEAALVMWSLASTRFTCYFDEGVTGLALQRFEDGVYVDCDLDWAMYQGYVTESGDTEIDITIRTSPDTYSPTSPKSFGNCYIEGAEEGMELTLLEGTSITPYFSGYPGYGEEVTFEDLAQHTLRQSKFLESVMQMFNLRLFVDERARKIYLDPLDEIYDSQPIFDWSDRVVEGEPITFEDCALGVRKIRKWGYQSADGVTNRLSGFFYAPGEDYPDAPESDPLQYDEEASSPQYGAWQRAIESYGAEAGEESILNPIFSPSQSTLSDVLIVGDRDDVAVVDTLEFSPRVARWCGTNDSGEPSVSFHNSIAGHTLCFEDRDGIEGLNRYYKRQIELEQRGQYITLALRLSPAELTSLFSVVEGMPNLMSRFSFVVQGERVECRIEAIEEYCIGRDGVARVKLLILK